MSYASIVIPVHKRFATLPYALHSIQNQTVSDIEIIIVGDGCTSQVKSICENLVNSDSRIVFLDFPKSPLRGVANRDKGVRSASSNRIFYCDDDDFFLPHHVEVLGENLTDCDIVDTPAITISPDGHIELAMHDSGHPLQKRLLTEEKFKGVFDTHLAHTKDAYTANAGAWLNANDPRVVLHMLKAFATDRSLNWKTINRITALSLHGARRAGMTADQRASEMKEWSQKIYVPGVESRMRIDGRYCNHLIRLLWALGHYSAEDQVKFLAYLGFAVCPKSGRAFLNGDQKDQEFTSVQIERINALLTFYYREKCDLKKIGSLIDQILNPLLGPGFPSGHILNLLTKIYNREEILSILSYVKDQPGKFLAEFQLTLINQGEFKRLLETVRTRRIEIPSFDRFFFCLTIAQGLLGHGLNEECHKWCNYMLEFPTHTRYDLPYWNLRKILAQRLNLHQELVWIDQQLNWFEGKI